MRRIQRVMMGLGGTLVLRIFQMLCPLLAPRNPFSSDSTLPPPDERAGRSVLIHWPHIGVVAWNRAPAYERFQDSPIREWWSQRRFRPVTFHSHWLQCASRLLGLVDKQENTVHIEQPLFGDGL